MRVSKRFKLPGCRFVPTTANTWRVVTSKIPRRFYRERERGKKELKAHRIMKAHLEAKEQREREKEDREREEREQQLLESQL
jgi:hypothetical protein